MTETLSYSTTLTVLSCGECGIPFALPSDAIIQLPPGEPAPVHLIALVNGRTSCGRYSKHTTMSAASVTCEECMKTWDYAEASRRADLAAHKASCHVCKRFAAEPGAPWCSTAIKLGALARKAALGFGDDDSGQSALMPGSADA